MTKIDWLANKRITVLGLGASGQSCARWLTAHDLPFTWFDSRVAPASLSDCQSAFPHVDIVTGPFDVTAFDQTDYLLISPGIPVTEPAIINAVKNGAEVLGDVELFCRLVDKPVIAVTGSNGKSTVVTFTGQLLNAAGLNTLVAGNIGLPVLDALQQGADCFVLELSSFQLASTQSLKQHIGCILNICEDHLDWHLDMDDYINAKQRIYSGAASAVFNRQDSATFPNANISKVSVGLDQPSNDQEYGLANGWLCRGDKPLVAVDACPLPESHNLFNLLTALALCQSLQVKLDDISALVSQLQGLPHRCELIKVANGVRWYNDSKATNVGATVAAISSLMNNVLGRIWLIAGGDSKGASFTELQTMINSSDIGLITLGKDGDLLAKNCDSAISVSSLDSAVKTAKDLVNDGDIVLLSPACSSLDMFTNYIERGNSFKRAVEALI